MTDFFFSYRACRPNHLPREPRFHPDDFELDSPDRIDDEELFALTSHHQRDKED